MKMKITMPVAMMSNIRYRKIGNYIRNSLFWFLLVFFSSNICSQNDVETWNSASLSYKLNNGIKLSGSGEIRLFNNSSEFKKALVDLGLDKKLGKYLELSVAYRYSRFFDNDGLYYNEQMAYGSISADYEIDRFTFTYTTRYQRSYDLLESEIVKTDNIWRNKLSVDYNIYQSPLSPFVTTELFTDINTLNNLFNDKFRLFGGCKYKVNKRSNIGLFVGLQKSIQKVEQQIIFGLKYSYSINSKKQTNNI